MTKSDVKGGPEYLAPEPKGAQNPKTGPKFGTEGATREEVNPYYEAGASAPINQAGYHNEMATAGVDHPADRRDVPDEVDEDE